MVKLWWGCWRYVELVSKHHQEEDSKLMFNKTATVLKKVAQVTATIHP